MRDGTPTEPAWADPDRVEEALAATADLGPYFAVHPDPGDVPPLSAMCAAPRLEALLAAVGTQIGTDEGRVAASTLQYGFAARCWSLLLGLWHRRRLLLDARQISFAVTGAGSIALTLTGRRAWDGAALSVDEAAAVLGGTVVAEPLTRMHAALRDLVGVADGLLWGNAASALISADRAAAGAAADERPTAVANAVLARPPLAGRLVIDAGTVVRRRSCCLWYRTRDRTTCGDCPLTGSRAHRESAPRR